MAATLYTGNGGTLTVSNAVNSISFQPDFVWTKPRVAASSNALFDSVRGASKILISNSTGAESNLSPYGLTAFNANGFSLSDDAAGDYYVNGASGGTYSGTPPNYVGWQWKGGGTGVSNTNGSVTSTVSANTTAGFSIATFTPPASGVFTFGHGLGVAPNMVIFKDRSTAGAWAVYHSSVGNTAALFLNTTGAISTSSGYFNNTSPSTTVVTGNVGGVCTGSSPTVAYSFAAISGYSAFGSYTGNASSDGPFVYFGFRPRYVMLKRSDTGGTNYNWFVYDSARDTYNATQNYLEVNLSSAEQTSVPVDFLSNGFKVRTASQYWNASGGTYIYAAFAENPFTISRAR
jgi:hypothetical protein